MAFHCDPSDHCNAKGSNKSTRGDWRGVVIFKHDENRLFSRWQSINHFVSSIILRKWKPQTEGKIPASKLVDVSPCRFCLSLIRVRFFKKIQDWILKSERIRKRILRFFTRQINPRSLGSWRVKGTEESISRVDSSVPLTHHDPRDLGLICLVKKRKIRFRILSDFKNFLKKRTLT